MLSWKELEERFAKTQESDQFATAYKTANLIINVINFMTHDGQDLIAKFTKLKKIMGEYNICFDKDDKLRIIAHIYWNLPLEVIKKIYILLDINDLDINNQAIINEILSGPALWFGIKKLEEIKKLNAFCDFLNAENIKIDDLDIMNYIIVGAEECRDSKSLYERLEEFHIHPLDYYKASQRKNWCGWPVPQEQLNNTFRCYIRHIKENKLIIDQIKQELKERGLSADEIIGIPKIIENIGVIAKSRVWT